MRHFKSAFIFLLAASLIATSVGAGERDKICGATFLTTERMQAEIREKSGDLLKEDEERLVLRDKLMSVIPQTRSKKLREYLENFAVDKQTSRRKYYRSHMILENEQDIENFFRFSSEETRNLGRLWGSKTLSVLRGNLWLYGMTLFGTYALFTHYDQLKEAGFSWETLLLLNFIAPKILLNIPKILRNLKQVGLLEKLEQSTKRAWEKSVEGPQVLSFETKVTQNYDRAGKEIPMDWKSFNNASLNSETPIAFLQSYEWSYWFLNQIDLVPLHKFRRRVRVDLIFFTKDGKRQMMVLTQKAI